ncbi:MAG: class I SAM-dependent methyltransferase [Anaerovoracaceae bacterium]
MNYSKRKMTQVADNPRGFWGRKMLQRMNDRHKGLIKWGISGIEIPAYQDILDIGCGSGNALSILYHKNKQAHLFGVDYSKDSVKMAKKNNRDAIDKGHMKIVHGNVLDLPYKENTFDLIVSVESFYYWKNHKKALAEISRVMKKNSLLILILEAHFDEEEPEKFKEIEQMLDMFIPKKEELISLLSAVGLQVKIETKGDWIKVMGSKS